MGSFKTVLILFLTMATSVVVSNIYLYHRSYYGHPFLTIFSRSGGATTTATNQLLYRFDVSFKTRGEQGTEVTLDKGRLGKEFKAEHKVNHSMTDTSNGSFTGKNLEGKYVKFRWFKEELEHQGRNESGPDTRPNLTKQQNPSLPNDESAKHTVAGPNFKGKLTNTTTLHNHGYEEKAPDTDVGPSFKGSKRLSNQRPNVEETLFP
jgi:hypothetical protein